MLSRAEPRAGSSTHARYPIVFVRVFPCGAFGLRARDPRSTAAGTGGANSCCAGDTRRSGAGARPRLPAGAQSTVEQPRDWQVPLDDLHQGEPLPSVFVAVYRDRLRPPDPVAVLRVLNTLKDGR